MYLATQLHVTMVLIYCTASTLTSTLLIGYYHGLLLKYIDADFMINKMHSNGLLAEELVLTGHSAHHKKWLLLEHVRHMQTETLMIFCETVQEISPKVGLQLITGIQTLL